VQIWTGKQTGETRVKRVKHGEITGESRVKNEMNNKPTDNVMFLAPLMDLWVDIVPLNIDMVFFTKYSSQFDERVGA